MKHLSSASGFDLMGKRTRKRTFLGEMDRVMPWVELVRLDAESGLVHSVVGTAANVHDLTPVDQLLHGEEAQVHVDAGYMGIGKREALQGVDVRWRVAMRPGKRRAMPHTKYGHLMRKLEEAKARMRAKVEHPFQVIKRQFGNVQVRYRGLAKNTAQLPKE